MPYPLEEPDPRPPRPSRPTHQVGAAPEQHEHPPVLGLGGLLPSVHHEPSGPPFRKRRTRCGQPDSPPPSHSGSESTAGSIGAQVALQDVSPEPGAEVRWRPDFDTPQGAVDPLEVGGVGDLLVTQELSPRAVRGIRQVVNGPLALVVPTGGRLCCGLPQKRKPPIDVAIGDQVDPESVNDCARPRTARGPRSSGSHSPLSAATGVRPPRAVRDRPNQRRTPNPL